MYILFIFILMFFSNAIVFTVYTYEFGLTWKNRNDGPIITNIV